MSTSTPFIRHQLAATRAGIPRPLHEVEDWLDRATALLTQTTGQSVAEWAYDLLVIEGRLRRTRPEMIDELHGAAIMGELQQLLAAEGRTRILPLALRVPSPAGWREQRAIYEAIRRGAEDLGEVAEAAELLLSDLDDMDLVLLAAERAGANVQSLRDDYDRCLDVAYEHLFDYRYCSIFVQALGMTLRPDLDAFDPALARTTEKYQVVLDLLEAEEYEDGGDWILEGNVDWGAGSESTAASPPPRANPVWLPPPLAIAASTPRPRTPTTLWFVSPSGDAFAALNIPDQLHAPDAQVTLTASFWTNRDAECPAQTLAGKWIELFPFRYRIEQNEVDQRIEAQIPLVDLRTIAAENPPPQIAIEDSAGTRTLWTRDV